MIRAATPADVPGICAVYNYYIRETVITFEEEPVSEIEMAQRVANVCATMFWLVAVADDGTIAGYAYAVPWKGRSAYRFSVESTIYLAPEAAGQGLGSKLYRALIDELRGRGVHSVVGGIALPNGASVALHEKMGFQKIGQFSEIGWKFGEWIDVGYWQLLL